MRLPYNKHIPNYPRKYRFTIWR